MSYDSTPPPVRVGALAFTALAVLLGLIIIAVYLGTGHRNGPVVPDQGTTPPSPVLVIE